MITQSLYSKPIHFYVFPSPQTEVFWIKEEIRKTHPEDLTQLEFSTWIIELHQDIHLYVSAR